LTIPDDSGPDHPPSGHGAGRQLHDDPLPTVTLYLDGHPIRSEVTRHMVTNIHNVTRDMGLVSCYADNGYGTPMQASRKITISSKYLSIQ
jgi:hypothetical protein